MGFQVEAEFPPKLQGLFKPKRYKVLYGGRAGAKSWGVARALLLLTMQKPLRVLCVREQMNSLKESVHKLLSDQIELLRLGAYFEIQQATIKCIAGPGAGSEFFFEGIRQNVNKIKSYEGIDICWAEEAHSMTKNSWDVLIPTIRKGESEIWITFNPDLETDETFKRFVKAPPPNSWVQEINWSDNPWLSEDMKAEILHLKETNYREYLHIYGGKCRTVLEGAVYEQELLDAEGSDRIMAVPYDRTVGVHAVFDLGWGDATAIWFLQRVGYEYRFIDYYENNRQAIDHYLMVMQGRQYIYDTVWLPHDAKAKQLGTGKSIEELVRAKGFKARIVPKLSLVDGINAGRMVFPQCYFDREKCEAGLHALRNYRYELVEDPVKRTFSRVPMHDWTSHGADAFRYAAVAVKLPQKGKEFSVNDAVSAVPDFLSEMLGRFGKAGAGGGWMGS